MEHARSGAVQQSEQRRVETGQVHLRVLMTHDNGYERSFPFSEAMTLRDVVLGSNLPNEIWHVVSRLTIVRARSGERVDLTGLEASDVAVQRATTLGPEDRILAMLDDCASPARTEPVYYCGVSVGMRSIRDWREGLTLGDGCGTALGEGALGDAVVFLLRLDKTTDTYRVVLFARVPFEEERIATTPIRPFDAIGVLRPGVIGGLVFGEVDHVASNWMMGHESPGWVRTGFVPRLVQVVGPGMGCRECETVPVRGRQCICLQPIEAPLLLSSAMFVRPKFGPSCWRMEALPDDSKSDGLRSSLGDQKGVVR